MGAILDLDQDVSEMNRQELLAKVAEHSGHRPPRERITKEMWNSIHAHLTGEFYCSPRLIDAGAANSAVAPDRLDVVSAALVAVSNRVTKNDLHEGDEPEVTRYMEVISDAEATGTRPRELRVGEIQEVIAALEDSPNKRILWRS